LQTFRDYPILGAGIDGYQIVMQRIFRSGKYQQRLKILTTFICILQQAMVLSASLCISGFLSLLSGVPGLGATGGKASSV